MILRSMVMLPPHVSQLRLALALALVTQHGPLLGGAADTAIYQLPDIPSLIEGVDQGIRWLARHCCDTDLNELLVVHGPDPPCAP